MVTSIFCVDKYVHVDTCLINPPPLQKSTFHHVTMSQLLETVLKRELRDSKDHQGQQRYLETCHQDVGYVHLTFLISRFSAQLNLHLALTMM